MAFRVESGKFRTQGGERSGGRKSRDAERHRGCLSGNNERRCGEHVPDPKPREAIRLRERVEHCEVGVRVQQREPVYRIGVGDELGVGLVKHYEAVPRHLCEERPELGLVYRWPRRIVRAAHENGPRAGRDRSGHRREIVSPVGREWHRNPGRAGHRSKPRIRLKGPPRIHHLRPRLRDRAQEILQKRHRPGPNEHLVRAPRGPLRDRFPQPRRHGIGIPIHQGSLALNGLPHRLKRLKRYLIARKLVPARWRLSPLPIRCERRNVRPHPHGPPLTHRPSLLPPPDTRPVALAAPDA